MGGTRRDTAPVITGQPINQALYVGDTAELRVEARGSWPLTYQWRKDGADLAGTTNALLVLTNVTLADAGDYTVTVSNAYGSATSIPAVVEVSLKAPEITVQPTDQTVCSGAPVSLSVSAAGSPPLTYQWQCNGQDLEDGPHIAGSRAGMLQISALCLGDLGSYSVTVANAFGSVRSSAAELTTSSAVLDTSVEAGLLTVSWNAPGRGMMLQWTPSLANPDWQDIPESELNSRMTFAMTEASLYFRLVRTLPQDLVAYYPLDGDANDHSGYGSHGRLVNADVIADRFGIPGGAVATTGDRSNRHERTPTQLRTCRSIQSSMRRHISRV